ncbi:hypothetical protein ABEB36_009206 [Hypothenemus hampei]|uniref:SWIM-type domain-containing protein n=1 Tax=Hypothenemus hampei TaxID=57062 RepID=A0ABD1EQ00_HYPHA
MDFSENYMCKYSEEVQFAHFGGSKPQITLHIVVTYHKVPAVNEPVTTCYCSLSKSLRHDPSAICAHLLPIIEEVKKQLPIINEVHFLSDGTMNVHEVVWTNSEPHRIRFRKLTCNNCSANVVCAHYDLRYNSYETETQNEDIGHVNNDHIYKIRYEDVYGSDTDSFEENLPITQLLKTVNCINSLQLNDYVLVKLSGKKQFHHYVAVVISIDDNNVMNIL